MGRKYRFQSRINAPRDLMLSMLTSSEFLVAEARESGAVEATCKVSKRGRDRLSLVLRKAEPARDDDGNVLEGKLDHIVMEQEWDLERGIVEWTHRMEELEGVVVSGQNRILEDGPASCLLIEVGEISLRTSDVPILGRLLDWFVAGQVIAGLKAERIARAAYLGKKAGKG